MKILKKYPYPLDWTKVVVDEQNNIHIPQGDRLICFGPRKSLEFRMYFGVLFDVLTAPFRFLWWGTKKVLSPLLRN